MLAKTLMIQGTASAVGKSILVTALCRIFRQDGYRVAPFKAQNMALNSFVTKEGGEIGRAQAVQAEAAGIEPTVEMNPVLLKPEAGSRCQVIVLGKAVKNLAAAEYQDHSVSLLEIIRDSLEHLRAANDIVVIEGAGSPAEINLKEKDIVNMRVARLNATPVLLVGDIDRGGVFASLVGTLGLLDREERELVKGLVVNKFRGDLALLKPGLDRLEKKARKPVLGVIPYFHGIGIAQEDSVYLDERPNLQTKGLDVAVIRLPHISNYDDFDPLEEMGCTVRYVAGPAELGQPDLIILPGTKSTVSDLMYLKQSGLDRAILRLVESHTPVIGICGGYQMLGNAIEDPLGVESSTSCIEGLGLLNCRTVYLQDKKTVQVKACVTCEKGLLTGSKGIQVAGYEIHMGRTTGLAEPAFQVTAMPSGGRGSPDGAVSADGFVFGTYLHGLFHNSEFTSKLLEQVRKARGKDVSLQIPKKHDAQYDELAQNVRCNLDMERVYRIACGRSSLSTRRRLPSTKSEAAAGKKGKN